MIAGRWAEVINIGTTHAPQRDVDKRSRKKVAVMVTLLEYVQGSYPGDVAMNRTSQTGSVVFGVNNE